MKFKIKTEKQLDTICTRRIKPMLDGKRVLALSVGPWTNKRTLEQNARLWAMLADIAEQVPVRGHFQSKEAWHFRFRIHFGYTGEVTPVRVDGIVVEMPLPRSSTEFSVGEMADYMTKIEAWAIDQGVIFQDLQAETAL